MTCSAHPKPTLTGSAKTGLTLQAERDLPQAAARAGSAKLAIQSGLMGLPKAGPVMCCTGCNAETQGDSIEL